nr:AraC family transcriptional regulator [Aminobacter aminovorans]
MRRLIEANVPEPDLGPEFLCQRLGMSRAKLYRLFEPIGGVGAYIQQRRLTRAYHALTDPAQAHLYVGIIAARCGFGSASVFSRAFRQAFGLSRPTCAPPITTPTPTTPTTPTTTRLRACGGSCWGWERGGGRGVDGADRGAPVHQSQRSGLQVSKDWSGADSCRSGSEEQGR